MNSKLNKTRAKSKTLTLDKIRNKKHRNRSYNGGEWSSQSFASSTDQRLHEVGGRFDYTMWSERVRLHEWSKEGRIRLLNVVEGGLRLLSVVEWRTRLLDAVERKEGFDCSTRSKQKQDSTARCGRKKEGFDYWTWSKQKKDLTAWRGRKNTIENRTRERDRK